MNIPAFSPNLLIITILVVLTLYGLVAGKHRLRTFLLSIYVGIVLAEQMARVVQPYLGFLSASQTKLALLGLPILIFGLFPQKGQGEGHDKGSFIANTLTGLLAGALIIASALHLLPTSELSAVDGESFIAMVLQQYYLWLLGLTPLVALILGSLRPAEHSKGKHH